MDYSLKQDGFEFLVEAEKERVKEEILSSYINLRKKKGITQQQIAELTGMQRTNIVRIESGRYSPTIEVLVKACSSVRHGS